MMEMPNKALTNVRKTKLVLGFGILRKVAIVSPQLQIRHRQLPTTVETRVYCMRKGPAALKSKL
jgi:hypothetical protein